ncbi:hypothetical protein [Aeromonas veronii]
MDFHAEQVQWLCGKPTEYASSDFIRRGFCAECGSTLTYRCTQYLTTHVGYRLSR